MSSEPSASDAPLALPEAWGDAVFEQAPVAMVVLRGTSLTELRVERANARAREMIAGHPGPGRALREVVPNLAPDFTQLVARVLTSGEAGSVSRVHQPQDMDGDGVPEDYWFNARVRPLRSTAGEIMGVVMAAVDVTDMVRALHEADALASRLRESEQNARILFRDAPVPMWVYDRQTLAIRDVNAAAVERYGYTRDEFLALTLRDLRTPEELAALEHILRTVKETEDVRRLRVRHRTKDGRVLQVDVTTQFITYDGRPARLALAQDVTAEQDALVALRESESRYMLAARASNHAIWDWDVARQSLTWTEGITTIFGYAPESQVATFDGWLTLVHPDDRDRVAASLASTQARADTVTAWEEVYRFQRADGTWADVHDRGYVSRTAQGEVVRMIGAMEDVTAQRQLEARLRQAQKMEAIGQLAGGIAHDFNNLLTVIGGSLEFARDGLPVDHAVRPDLEEIAAATERARTLVRQLLTFSRQQTVQPRLVQVSEVVHGMERLLRRVIGEEITLHVIADYDKAPVRIDPGQLEQVLMNLAVNARDAMLTPRFGHPGSGGSLTIEVSRTVAASPGGSSATTTSAGGERRRCVQLVVRDTGHGIDADTRAHLFEPFFTTKDVGSGTGLGLATVHGIVTQAGGTIHVDSAPGAGAAFTILLPEADLPAERTTPRRPLPVVPAMPATVLVVEDEAPVRAVVRRTLERHGLQVLEARHGVDALLLWRRNRDDIRVVLTDVRMPEMGGHELAAALRRERPDLPVIFVSGYADHAATEVLGAFDRFVEKPFTSEALLAALVDVLRDSATPLRG